MYIEFIYIKLHAKSAVVSNDSSSRGENKYRVPGVTHWYRAVVDDYWRSLSGSRACPAVVVTWILAPGR